MKTDQTGPIDYLACLSYKKPPKRGGKGKKGFIAFPRPQPLFHSGDIRIGEVYHFPIPNYSGNTL